MATYADLWHKPLGLGDRTLMAVLPITNMRCVPIPLYFAHINQERERERERPSTPSPTAHSWMHPRMNDCVIPEAAEDDPRPNGSDSIDVSTVSQVADQEDVSLQTSSLPTGSVNSGHQPLEPLSLTSDPDPLPNAPILASQPVVCEWLAQCLCGTVRGAEKHLLLCHQSIIEAAGSVHLLLHSISSSC